MKKVCMVTNVMFVTYSVQNIFHDYLLRSKKSKLLELPNEVIRVLRSDKDHAIQLILFDGSKNDAYTWATMCAGDRFVSFMEEMVRYQDKVLILVPEKEKRILNKEFLNAGYSVREYGKKGLQPSSICEIAYNKEGTERIVQPVESVCVN